eukprot:gene2401-2865_t
MRMRRFAAQNQQRASGPNLKRLFVLTLFIGAFVSGLVLFYMSISSNKMNKESYGVTEQEIPKYQTKPSKKLEKQKNTLEEEKKKLEKVKQEKKWLKEQLQKRKQEEERKKAESAKAEKLKEQKRKQEAAEAKKKAEQKILNEKKKRLEEEKKRLAQQKKLKQEQEAKRKAEEEKKKMENERKKKENEKKKTPEKKPEPKQKSKGKEVTIVPEKEKEKEKKVKVEKTKKVEVKPKISPKNENTKKPEQKKEKPKTETNSSKTQKPKEDDEDEEDEDDEEEKKTTKKVTPTKAAPTKPKKKIHLNPENSVLKGLRILYYFIKESEDDFLEKFPESLECFYRMIMVKSQNPKIGERASKYLKKLLTAHQSTYITELKGSISEHYTNIPKTKKEFKSFIKFIQFSDFLYYMKVLNIKDDVIQSSMNRLFKTVAGFKNSTEIIKKEVFGFNINSINQLDELADNLRKLPRNENGVIVKDENSQKFLQMEDHLETIFNKISISAQVHYYLTRSGQSLPGVKISDFFDIFKTLRKFYYLIPESVDTKNQVKEENLKKLIMKIQFDTYKSLVDSVVTFIRLKSDLGLFKIKSTQDVYFLKEAIRHGIFHREPSTVGSAVDALLILGEDQNSKIINEAKEYLMKSQDADGHWDEEMAFKGLCNSMTGLIKHDSTKSVDQFVSNNQWEDAVKKIKF